MNSVVGISHGMAAWPVLLWCRGTSSQRQPPPIGQSSPRESRRGIFGGPVVSVFISMNTETRFQLFIMTCNCSPNISPGTVNIRQFPATPTTFPAAVIALTCTLNPNRPTTRTTNLNRPTRRGSFFEDWHYS